MPSITFTTSDSNASRIYNAFVILYGVPQAGETQLQFIKKIITNFIKKEVKKGEEIQAVNAAKDQVASSVEPEIT